MFEFTMSKTDLRRYSAQMQDLARRHGPLAVRKALTKTAIVAREEGQANIADQMILRNKFIKSRVFWQGARGMDINTMASAFGSPLEALETQETGGVVKGKRGNKPIPTSYSSGEGTSVPRRRIPRRANQMRNIQLGGKNLAGLPRRQRNVAMTKRAASEGRKFVYLEMGRGKKGIFKVLGGKRRPKLRMVHDLTRRSVRVPKNEWMRPAALKAQRGIGRMYFKDLVRRARL